MAITNHERIGKALDLLRQGLAPFVEREVQAAVKAGTVRIDAVQRFADDPLLGKKPVAQWDAAGLLKLMWGTYSGGTRVSSAVGSRTSDRVPARGVRPRPRRAELHTLLQTVVTRLMKMLTRRGVLIEEMGQACLAEHDADGEQARALRALQAAAITCRIAFGPRAGQKVLTFRGAMPREVPAHRPLCARH